MERIVAAKESLRRIRLGGVDQVSPSVCCYTFTNAYGSVTAVDICDDSSLIAAGSILGVSSCSYSFWFVKVLTIHMDTLQCIKIWFVQS